ncbi:MAG: hypothetical protein DMG05_19470 [Acidobacteria bacterium]|nr:MAG: hypothetical protein DMG05_19470 [Acidobacteriota bacterium]
MMKRPKTALAVWVLTSSHGAWAPILVFGLHVIFSRVLGAYLAFPRLDVPMHFFGGIAITYFLGYAFAVAAAVGFLGSPNRTVLLLLVFFTACSAAVFWEFAEFLSDRFLGTHAQLGLNDTLSDMLLGMVGALVYLAANRFRLPVVSLTRIEPQPETARDNA